MKLKKPMKPLFLAVMTCAAVLTFVANAGCSTNDPLTELPLYPGVTDSNPLPKATVCKSQMQGDFYMVRGNKVDTVTDWYAKHLNGFKKYHAMTGSRSQDTFFNSDGTQEVTVTGTPDSTDVYSISYGRFQPGLPASQIPVFNIGKQVCK
jgi:hypothetical protein